MTTKHTKLHNSLAALLALVSLFAAVVSAVRYWPFRQPTAIASARPASNRLEEIRSSKKGLRVLFVGNSHTASNDMPEMVHQLAEAAGDELPLLFEGELPGGFRLKEHSESDNVANLLKEIRWDYVILQEQSQHPSFSRFQRARDMDPYVEALDDKIKAAGGRTVLFMTWGYKDGDQMNVAGDSYAAMQQRLREGYQDIATKLSIQVAPVGLAWQEVLKRRPQFDLWDADGIHPSLKGSYLSACVFYAVLYGKDPTGNSFTANLERSEARLLQQAAAHVTRKQPPRIDGE
jgi:hypothetical protein